MAKAQQQKKRKRSSVSRWLGWAAVIAVVAAAGYGISQMSNIAFDEDDIRVVNFQGLTAKQKREALEAANGARCTCGCGLGLAQCVSTDPSCPLRESNIDRIKGMVRTAMSSSD